MKHISVIILFLYSFSISAYTRVSLFNDRNEQVSYEKSLQLPESIVKLEFARSEEDFDYVFDRLKPIKLKSFLDKFKNVKNIEFPYPSMVQDIDFLKFPKLNVIVFPYGFYDFLPITLCKTQIRRIVIEEKTNKYSLTIDSSFIKIYNRKKFDFDSFLKEDSSFLNRIKINVILDYKADSDKFCALPVDMLEFLRITKSEELSNCLTANPRISCLQVRLDKLDLGLIRNMKKSPNRKYFFIHISDKKNLDDTIIELLKSEMLGKNIILELL